MSKNYAIGFIFVFFKNFFKNDIIGQAAQTAFFLMLSMPSLIIVALVVINRASVDWGSEYMVYLLPKSVLSVFEVVSANVPSGSLTVFSTVATLFGASGSAWALMKGVYKSYSQEKLKFSFGNRLTAILFTVFFIPTVLLSLVILVAGGEIAKFLFAFFDVSPIIWNVGRRLTALLVIFLFIEALYIFTPKIKNSVKDVFPGALTASCGWMAVSYLFEIYLARFNRYSFFGGIGAFLALIIWLYIISLIVLFGAEINATNQLVKKEMF